MGCVVVLETNQRSSGGGFRKNVKKIWGQSHTQVGQSLIVKLTTTHNPRCSNPHTTVSTSDFEGGCEVHTNGLTVQTEGGVRVIWYCSKSKEIKMSASVAMTSRQLVSFLYPLETY